MAKYYHRQLITQFLITESLGDGKLVVSKSESKYKSVSGKVVVANRDIETGETKYSKDFPLIKYVTQTGMPMTISTGMTDVEEIQEAIEAVQEGGCEELAILHCVSGYPAPARDYNLKTLVDMQQKFGLVTGLSDHTIDNTTAIASVALGAAIIEKHVTLDRNGGGPDDSFSLESKELLELCNDVKTAWKSLGKVNYGIKSSEKGNVKFRRSLYFMRDIEIGEIITEEHVKSIRPGYGLSPKFLGDIIGKVAIKKTNMGDAVKFDHIDNT